MKERIHHIVTHRMHKNHVLRLVEIEQASQENFWHKDIFNTHIKSRSCGGLIAASAHHIAGFVAFERCQVQKMVQIWNLVVAPEFQRQGVGLSLLQRLTDWLACDYDTLRFNVRESNLPAQLFLRKFGFLCDVIARNYFIDYFHGKEFHENAYCFVYNPKGKKENVTLRIVDRESAPSVCLRKGRRIPSNHR